jgi:dephospho-CoA kinase
MVLGITGISGSGKHTAAKYFESKGWVILDADKISHDTYRPYSGAWKAVVQAFGENILNQDDTVNRVKLGKIVFNPLDPEGARAELEKLNKIVHPFVKRQIIEDIHHHTRTKPNIAIVVALWEEAELEDICEKILLLRSDPELRSKRVKLRDSISEEAYQIRVSHQNEPPKPDFTVENNGSVQELNNKLNEILS